MNPALWADIRRDLDAAERHVRAAPRRAGSLADASAALDPEIQEDREAAVGLLIHNCYGAMESVLERIVQAVDGGLPTGPETARALQKPRSFRHAFRHAYDGYDYARAAEKVPIAEAAVPGFRREVADFARKVGIAPEGRARE